jgi:transcriptional regulator with XRE-family HTH domain
MRMMTRTTMCKIGKAIRAAREAQGMTQQELGTKLGYSEKTAQSFVCMWETGTRPVPRTKIMALCKLLGLDPLSFLM